MRDKVAAETHAFRLARKDVMGLDGAAGMEVRVHYGVVWLTQEGDRRDIVVHPGQGYRFDRDGRASIEALISAEISFVTPTV